MTALADIAGEIPSQLSYVVPETGDADSYMHALGVNVFERFNDPKIRFQTYRCISASPRTISPRRLIAAVWAEFVAPVSAMTFLSSAKMPIEFAPLTATDIRKDRLPMA